MDVDAHGRIVGSGRRLAVATEEEKMCYAKEIEVEQGIFSLFLGETGAYDMGYGRDAVAVLYGRCHGHGPRSFEHGHAPVATVGLRQIDIFAVVRRDVYVLRLELAQGVDGLEYLIYAVAFERRQNFKRKLGLSSHDLSYRWIRNVINGAKLRKKSENSVAVDIKNIKMSRGGGHFCGIA